MIPSSAMASKCPLKLLLPLVILKDSNMTLEVDTRENVLDTGSHSLQHRCTNNNKKLCEKSSAEKQAQGDQRIRGSPVQNAPSHGQQGIIHGQGVTHTVAGLYEERGDGQTDERARDHREFYMAAHTTP